VRELSWKVFAARYGLWDAYRAAKGVTL